MQFEEHAGTDAALVQLQHEMGNIKLRVKAREKKEFKVVLKKKQDGKNYNLDTLSQELCQAASVRSELLHTHTPIRKHNCSLTLVYMCTQAHCCCAYS